MVEVINGSEAVRREVWDPEDNSIYYIVEGEDIIMTFFVDNPLLKPLMWGRHK